MRDSSSTKRRLLGFYPPTLWDYIRWLLVYMVDGYLWIVSSLPTCYWLLQRQYYYSITTTVAGVIVPRVIAVGQHCSSAPRNPFLSQRLKCETTGRSATVPDLDDKGSPRGAAHRCTHYRTWSQCHKTFFPECDRKGGPSRLVLACCADETKIGR